MNPSTVNAAAAALLQGRKPGLPSRPSRKLLHAVVDTAARAAPAAGTTPATVLHTFRRQLGTAAAFLPDPILLAAVSAAARRFSAGSVAVDPAFPWLSLLLEGTPADAPAATAITSAPSALARAAALPSRNLIAVDPANCPGTLSANHELHLAAWWTCPSGSVAVWTHDATPPETAPAATPLPSASALSTLLAGYRPAQRNSALNVPRRIADAVRRADASFSGVQQVSASPIPLPPRREGIWVPWQPSFRYWLSAVPAGGPQLDSLPPHPTPLSIPSSLQDLQPPTPAAFTIPKSLLRSNALSDAQFEAYALASSALQTAIPRQSGPQPARKGFLVADSTGSGKGRILAALLASAWGQGSRRAIWISSTPDLIADARRDWSDINGDPDLIIPLDPGNLPRHDGILFASYAALRNDSTRTNLVAWLRRAEPDGNPSPTIVFDESHTTASATSAQARSARILQHRIPDARVVYASATATRNTVSWIFGDRLALWESPDTCFDGPLDLIEHLHPHGLSALQILFRHASGHGAAITRSLRLDDVPFQPLECPLDRAQKQTQTNWSRAWRLALIAYMKAYRASHPKPAAGPNPPSAKRQAFDEAHGIETNSNIPANAITALRQAFFRSLITSFKTKRLIRAIEKDIAEGRQAVIQLESTLETHAARAIARYAEQEGWTPETGHPLYLPDDVDISPAGDIARRARDAFVVHKMEPDPDSDPANPTLRPALDANGDPIPSPRSIIARDRAFRALSRHHTPVPLLDALVMHFGDDLAEVTGRTTRVETAPPDAFGRTTVVRSRSHHDATREADDFQAGIRRVLVFSAAGSTGRSYHDDTQNPVAAQRVHYVVQPSWDTPTLIQGLGRTHRSNQRTPPILRLVTTDLAGEIRYVANASSNIERMGASNRAHTKAQTSMRFEDLPRFDTRPARQALADLTQRATFTGLPGMSTREFTDVTGIVDSTRATIPFLKPPPHPHPRPPEARLRRISQAVPPPGPARRAAGLHRPRHRRLQAPHTAQRPARLLLEAPDADPLPLLHHPRRHRLRRGRHRRLRVPPPRQQSRILHQALLLHRQPHPRRPRRRAHPSRVALAGIQARSGGAPRLSRRRLPPARNRPLRRRRPAHQQPRDQQALSPPRPRSLRNLRPQGRQDHAYLHEARHPPLALHLLPPPPPRIPRLLRPPPQRGLHAALPRLRRPPRRLEAAHQRQPPEAQTRLLRRLQHARRLPRRPRPLPRRPAAPASPRQRAGPALHTRPAPVRAPSARQAPVTLRKKPSSLRNRRESAPASNPSHPLPQHVPPRTLNLQPKETRPCPTPRPAATENCSPPPRPPRTIGASARRTGSRTPASPPPASTSPFPSRTARSPSA